VSEDGVHPQFIVDIARSVGIDPIWFGALLEQESNAGFLPPPAVLAIYRFPQGIDYSPGLGNVQITNAYNTLLSHETSFADTLSYIHEDRGTAVWELAHLMFNNDHLSIRIAAYFISDLQDQIVEDLSREAGINLSQDLLEEVIMVAYNSGWTNTQGTGFLDALRRHQPSGWLNVINGILYGNETESPNKHLIDVRSHRSEVEECFREHTD
jgi:hypothetical protein